MAILIIRFQGNCVLSAGVMSHSMTEGHHWQEERMCVRFFCSLPEDNKGQVKYLLDMQDWSSVVASIGRGGNKNLCAYLLRTRTRQRHSAICAVLLEASWALSPSGTFCGEDRPFCGQQTFITHNGSAHHFPPTVMPSELGVEVNAASVAILNLMVILSGDCEIIQKLTVDPKSPKCTLGTSLWLNLYKTAQCLLIRSTRLDP